MYFNKMGNSNVRIRLDTSCLGGSFVEKDWRAWGNGKLNMNWQHAFEAMCGLNCMGCIFFKAEIKESGYNNILALVRVYLEN